MFTRAFVELFGAALLTRGFWICIGIMVLLGWAVQSPVVAVGLALTLVGLIAWAWPRKEPQTLPVNGTPISVKKFQCSGCGSLGTLRIERRSCADPDHADRVVKWPVAVCDRCGAEEQVPGRIVPPTPEGHSR